MSAKAEVERRKSKGLGFAHRAGFYLRLTRYALLLVCALATSVAGVAEAQTSVSNVGRGTPAQYVKVTGVLLEAQARGDDLHIRVENVRLESTGKLPAVSYTALGVAVFQGGSMVRASWEFDARGELTSAKPAATIAAEEFVMPGAAPQCLKSACEVRLQLRVERAPGRAHAEHTDLAALTVRRTEAIRKPVPGKRGTPGKMQPKPTQTLQGWEYRIVLAGAAMREQRLPDAGRLLNEALAMVEKAQGPGRPGTARVQYWTAHLHAMQKNSAEQEQSLLSALGILEKYPDAEVRKAIGIPGGDLDKEIVARQLGDFYWAQRRYERSYVYFERAYRYVADVAMPIEERNRRLALDSAGQMVTACSLQNWPVAERSLKELKERIVHVDGDTRTRLESWARSVEPRIAARNC